MSANVILNNVVYNNVNMVKLPLASGGGLAIFEYSGDTPIGPMYSMGDGEYTSAKGTKVTVDGNHVKIETVQGYSTAQYSVCFNATKMLVAENDNTVLNNNTYWFTLPAGNAVLDVTNIVGGDRFQFTTAARDVGGSTSVIASGMIGAGGTTHTEVTLNEAKDVGAIIVYAYAGPNLLLPENAVLEFDVELWVDNVQYI